MYLFKGYLSWDQLDADVDKLTAYYRSFGFFQARVGRVIEMNDNDTWATVRFIVVEGPRYQVDEISFVGNKVFANDSLAMLIQLPSGKPFEQAEMSGDTQRLKDLYGSRGYVFADIRPETVFLEEPGKLRLVYHIDEGKQWRVGRVFVHINGDNPHTRIQTALNRLSIHPGEICDTRQLRASEIRIQRSQLFMVEPARGVVPKISFHIQDSDAELASGGKNEFRGQSPDQIELVPSDRPGPLSQSAAPGPPLLAPPGSHLKLQTIEVPPPPGFVDRDDQIDVHLEFDDAPQRAAAPSSEPANAAPPEQRPRSPAAQRHEVRRPPYEDIVPPAFAPPVSRPVGRPTLGPYELLQSQGNAYQQIPAQPAATSPVVRGQSPYPAATSTSVYGGVAVGATGPEAARIGTSAYAVRQAASSPQPRGPQIVPTQYSVPSGTQSTGQNGATPGPPVFGPPALPPPQYGTPQPIGPPQPLGTPQPLGAPQPVGTPVYAQPLPGGPPPVMTGDPNVAPVTPIPTNPQLFPSTPVDPFTPAYTDPFVDLDVVVSEAQTGRLMLGVAVNSDAGLVGQILLDEQNFDWTRYPTSWDDFLSGKAWRGAGQRFRLEAAPGTQVQRYLASFQEPYLFDYPISLGLSGSYYTRRYFEWDEQRLGGRVSLGYQWTEYDLSAALAYRGEVVNISNIKDNIPDLEEVKGDNTIHGFKYTIANDTRDSIFLATQGHYLEVGIEQVIGSFTYPRFNLDARQYFLLHERPDHSGRHVLTAASQVDISGNNTPIYEPTTRAASRRFAAGITEAYRPFSKPTQIRPT